MLWGAYDTVDYTEIEESNAKIDLIKFCRIYYKYNQSKLKQVSEFEEQYDPLKAIQWFTRDGFIFRIVNKALRTKNLKIIYKFRYFLSHLYKQLNLVHLSQRKTPLIVYRGQQLSAYEIKSFCQPCGLRLSITTFMSTSIHRDVALIFSGTGSLSPFVESVLFEITINSQSSQVIYADIKDHSFFKEEGEVLFCIGTIFKVLSAERDEKLWIIRMELENDEKLCFNQTIPMQQRHNGLEDYIISIVQKSCDNVLQSQINTHLLDKIRSTMSKEKISTCFREGTKEDEITRRAYNDSLNICLENNDIFGAGEFYVKIFDLAKKIVDENHLFFITPYTLCGCHYHSIGQYDVALKYYKKSLELRKQRNRSQMIYDCLDIVWLWNCFADVYINLNDYTLATRFIKKALREQLQATPYNHTDFKFTLYNIIRLRKAGLAAEEITLE
ncbi:unnamed protein product [Adineta steineri]|uniref:NAD(P)(+)--arginine ADP-ribosyltransferase n=1 Tax=Adineta steineri TaxID=433720 RepID=A0A819PNX5_9BILA|nr:unnamed protein product [Adineta steineri]CAF4012324.1 unnamed protein product [Adineta steineri]